MKVINLFLISISFFTASVTYSADYIVPIKPNYEKTPGDACTVYDPDFHEYRYGEGIPYCRRNVSSARRRQIYELYKVEASRRQHYTIDHLIPLSIGGSNTDENLWPEHVKVKQTRQDLEYELFQAVRDGRMTQEEAVNIVLHEKFNPPKDEIYTH